MKIVHFLIPSFVVASITVGTAIATVNQPTPNVQLTPSRGEAIAILWLKPEPCYTVLTSSLQQH